MEVKLKNIKVNLQFSEETIMFKADVYINGYKAAYADNEGRGGCTFYRGYDDKGRELIKEAEAYYKSLPPKKYTIGTHSGEYPQSLESAIDDIISEYVESKEKDKHEKKIKKMMLNYAVFSKGENADYLTFGFKGMTIEQVLVHPLAKTRLIEKIKELKRNGYWVINDNIPQEMKEAV